MANSNTTYLNLIKPEVGADTDQWGNHINTDLDTLDAILGGVTAVSLNTVGKNLNVTANTTYFKDATDATKVARFSAASISAASTRTYTLPDVTDTLVTLTATQTLTNKTLTSPTVSGGTLTSPTVSGGTVDNASVGASTRSTGAFTTLTANNTTTFTGGIGKNAFGTVQADSFLAINGNSTSGQTYGVHLAPTHQSTAVTWRGFYAQPSTAAASFTMNSHGNFVSDFGTLGAGSVITNLYGFLANASLGTSGATNSFGFFSNLASGTGVWNFYSQGTADNAFRGDTRFGGLTAPAATVDITGTLVASSTVTFSNLAGTGSRTVTASATGVLAAASDRSLKQEVPEAVVPGLAEIMQIQPRAYKWLDDIAIRGENAAVEIGFFANDVAPVIPSAAPQGNDGLYGFYDRSMVAALVKAVQELKALNDGLQARVAVLEAQ